MTTEARVLIVFMCGVMISLNLYLYFTRNRNMRNEEETKEEETKEEETKEEEETKKEETEQEEKPQSNDYIKMYKNIYEYDNESGNIESN